MKLERDLWQAVKDNIKNVHWQRIETGDTASGVPDLNGARYGCPEVWVELKRINGSKVGLTSFQVGWLIKREKYGGNTFILAFKPETSRWAEGLYLWPGHQAREVYHQGVNCDGLLMDWSNTYDTWQHIERFMFPEGQ